MYQLQVSFGSVKTDAIYDSARCAVSLFFYNFTETLNEAVKSRNANVIKKSKNQKIVKTLDGFELITYICGDLTLNSLVTKLFRFLEQVFKVKNGKQEQVRI